MPAPATLGGANYLGGGETLAVGDMPAIAATGRARRVLKGGVARGIPSHKGGRLRPTAAKVKSGERSVRRDGAGFGRPVHGFELAVVEWERQQLGAVQPVAVLGDRKRH